MLAGENLSVRRGDRMTLNDVAVAVRPGVLIAVVGPNGAGKSTLVAALTDLVRLETGTVTLDGAPLASLSRAEVAKRISVLSQHYRSTFPFKAFEIVALGRSAHHGREARADEIRFAEAAMAATDTLQFADRRIDALSGGERQRIFLARALAQIMPLSTERPRYLLLDEPTASLDLRHQAAVLRFARDVVASGVGVLAVLHDLNLAAAYADDVLLLHDGRRVGSGPPALMLQKPLLGPVYGDGLRIFEGPDGAPVVLPEGPAAERPSL